MYTNDARQGYYETILDLQTDEQKIAWAKTTYANYNLGRAGKLKQSMAARRFYEGDHAGYANFLMSTPNPTFVNKYGRRVPYAETLIENKRTMIMQSHPRPTISRKLNAQNLKHAEVISMSTQEILDQIWATEDVDQLLNDFVMDAMIDGLGFLQLYTDRDGIHVTHKQFDSILCPVDISDMDSSPTVGIKFSDTIGKYKNNPDYKNTEELRPTAIGREWDFIDMYAHETDMKIPNSTNSIMSLNKFDAVEWQTLITLDSQTINKLKGKYKWVADKEIGDRIMWILTVSGGVVIRDQYMNIDSYYLYPYCPLGGDWGRPSLFTRLISMGKAYDVLWTTLEEYASFAMKYRVIVPRETIMTPMTNQNGTVIRYTGEPPVEMNHSDVSAGYFDMLSKYEEVMQTLANINGSSMGEMPSGSKKFKALESQKLQDMANSRPMIDGLKKSIKKMCEGIMDLVDESYEIKDIVYNDKDGVHPIKVVGNGYAQANPTSIDVYNHTDKGSNVDYESSSQKDTGLPGPELVIVHKDYPVEIAITQGLDYSEQGVQNDLLDLAKSLPQDSPLQKAFIKAWVASKDVGDIQRYLYEAEREMEEDEANGIQRPDGGDGKVSNSGPVQPHVHLDQAPGGIPAMGNPTNLAGAGVPGNPQGANAPMYGADMQNLSLTPQGQGQQQGQPQQTGVLPGMVGA
jgi:hypothetical protein